MCIRDSHKPIGDEGIVRGTALQGQGGLAKGDRDVDILSTGQQTLSLIHIYEQIPKIIAVDALPPDVEALQQALNQKRGSEVQLYVDVYKRQEQGKARGVLGKR